MEKYFLVARNTWDEMLIYRLNVIIWRLRMVLSLLTTYFIWLALLPQGQTFFGYSQSSMLTYILGTGVIAALVFSSRSGAVGDEIINGNLSNYLIRPINYFLYWYARDWGDKAMNVLFSIVEFSLLVVILHPPIFLQTNIIYIVLSIIAMVLAITLYFLINLLIGMGGFWMQETWSLRFLLFVIIQFFAGGLFPLDILPTAIKTIFEYLPFQYLLYFPIKLYLGNLSPQAIFQGLIISFVWVALLYFFVLALWKKGLREYTAVGR